MAMAEREALLEVATEQLQDEQPAWPFVEVIAARSDPNCGEGARAADTQHELLAQRCSWSPAYETIGDGAIARAVLGQVGVEHATTVSRTDVAAPYAAPKAV
jgi:hypothetical protein